MNDESMSKLAADLLSIPPLVFRIIRKKLVKTTLADLNVDIKYTHFEVLNLLEQEGTLHVARIGEQLELAKAQMTHLLDHLVSLGFVERESDASDRRTFNIALTPAGRRFIRNHQETIISAALENMSSLEACELESLCGALRSLRDVLFKMESRPLNLNGRTDATAADPGI
jgi:DNA-binding MarR family transcriptional regulator